MEARRMMWMALERAKKEGLVRAIGVSNYGVGHIEEIKSFGAATFPPAVNQVELHPWCQQEECVRYCVKEGIVLEAYCPLVRNQKAEHPTLKRVVERCGKSAGQVLLRWSLQKGWVPLPKSDTESRIKANADLYGWELGKEDMEALDGLDQGAKGAIVQAVDNGS